MRKIFVKRVEESYQTFIRNDFTQWMNFMLAIGVFQCYSSAVQPYEAKLQRDEGQTQDDVEVRNYKYFFNRYVQLFYKSQPYLEIRRLTD